MKEQWAPDSLRGKGHSAAGTGRGGSAGAVPGLERLEARVLLSGVQDLLEVEGLIVPPRQDDLPRPAAVVDEGLFVEASTVGVELTLYRVSNTSGTRHTSNPGTAVDTFWPGQTVRVTLKAVNTGPSVTVAAGLTLYGPDNVTVIYDSHALGQDVRPAGTLATGQTQYYSFDWTLPGDAACGAYDLEASVRAAGDWNVIYDTTAPGAATTALGLPARLRDKFWRFQNAPANRTTVDTSEYLAGRVWVNVVLPESTGPSSTENWTPQQIADVKAQVQQGVSWWAGVAPNAHVSFCFDWTHADNPVAIDCEPINMPHTSESLWVPKIMDAIYAGSGDYLTRVRNYDDLTRRAGGCDWAFTIFVINDFNDPDNKFSDGWGAYAYLGGPYMVLTYDSGNWGNDRMHLITAHEVGHIFYALDEYPGSAKYTNRAGYYNTQNLNAYDGNPDPSTRVPSIMAEVALMEIAYAQQTSSPTCLQMTGYRDSDGDGIIDVLDTVPSLATTVLESNGAGGYVRISATGAVQPMTNSNPWSANHAISLNIISAIQYRVDLGPWITVAASDGFYDRHTESAVFTVDGLTYGQTVYVRAVSSIGSWQQWGNVSAVSTIGAPSRLGDTNLDGLIDARDIDALYAGIRAGSTDPLLDLNKDGKVNQLDVDRLVRNILLTEYGDLNLDRRVDLDDLIQLSNNWSAANAGWARGDVNGDTLANSADLAILSAYWGFGAGLEQQAYASTTLAPPQEAQIDLVVQAPAQSQPADAVPVPGEPQAAPSPQPAAAGRTVRLRLPPGRWPIVAARPHEAPALVPPPHAGVWTVVVPTWR